MKNGDEFFLNDIKTCAENIFKYTKGMERSNFIKDQKTIDAVIRNFEIMGEAVKKLSPKIREDNPQIPFKQIAGMRDKLIHDYFGVDYIILWKTIKDKLPEFYNELKTLI